LVDCGDFGSTKVKSQIFKVNYLLTGMALLNYDAINLGEKDLQYGSEFLSEMGKMHKLPFVSANVYKYGTEELFAQPYLIKQKGNLKIGIFGVTTQSGARHLVKPATGFEVKDPMPAAQKSVNELRQKCDVVIALAHLGLNGAKELAQKVSGIDIIISGHDTQRTQKPAQIGKTVVMQTGSKGQYLGHLEFKFASNSVSLTEGKLVTLNDQIPDDQKLARLISEFDKSFISSYPLQSSKAIDDFSLLSERSCVQCHRKEHRQWSSTLHRKAWQSLVDKQQTADPECQQCHTTLFKQANGFSTIFENPDLVNVQCVDCHNLAEDSPKEHINKFRRRRVSASTQTNGKANFKPVREASCLRCHDKENSPNFSYAEALLKVTH